jgi:hypothetical protein
MSLTSVSPSLVRLAVGGWSLFIAENVLLSHNRTFVIELLDNQEEHYHYVYGTCSTVATLLIAYGYKSVRNQAPFFPSAGTPTRRALALGLQAAGLVGLSQMAPKLQVPVALAPPSPSPASPASPSSPSPAPAPANPVWQVRCPFDFTPSKDDSVQGMARISRHSSLWSFASLSLGSAFAAASIPQALCLSGPLAVALIGGAHQDYRFRRGVGGNLPPDLDKQTSNVPFAAMLLGNQKEGVLGSFVGLADEIKWLNAGVAATVALGLAARRARLPPIARKAAFS